VNPSRRSFLATVGAAALGALARPTGAIPLPSGAIDRVGVQLYTVRSAMQRDVAGTLASVAEIGYRAVEFAGYFDRSPAEIATLLRRHSLTAPSTHIGYDVLRSGWQRALDDAATIGHEYITIPWIAADERKTTDDWKRVAALFNEGAAQARAAGLRFAYHNHDFEFERMAGVVPFDVLLENTDPALVDFELDIYWIVRAGFDPLDYIARFPGRIRMTHLKDSDGPPDHRMTSVGSGIIDFPRVIAAANEAGASYHFVEHDQPADALASIRSSYAYLAGLNN
jgi:sugar phosphate isomerase/epimerase